MTDQVPVAGWYSDHVVIWSRPGCRL